MIIIFEGPDKCGKTEIARALSKRLGIPYFKNPNESRAFKHDNDYFVNALVYGDSFFYEFLKQTGTSVILDRSYPSEWVYSKEFDRDTSEQMLKYIDKLACEAGAVIISPYRTTYSGIVDEESGIKEDMLLKLDVRYLSFLNWTQCPTLRLCVDDEDTEREVSEILKFLKVMCSQECTQGSHI
jgi:hypothetical protein